MLDKSKCDCCGANVFGAAWQCSPDSTEANQAQPESDTTACLPAGCGPNEETAARLPGWQARLRAELTIIKTDVEHLYRSIGDATPGQASCVGVIERHIQKAVSITEEADA